MKIKEVIVEKGSDADKTLPNIFFETNPHTGKQIKCQKVVVKKKGTSQTEAKGILYDGIWFKSVIETYMYQLLQYENINFAYEGQSFEIVEEFIFLNPSYERFLNGKGKFKERGKNKRNAAKIYTPDFTPPVGEPLAWAIEVKGRAFADFSRTWTLFKTLITKNNWNTVLFIPRTKGDCNEVINILKNNQLT